MYMRTRAHAQARPRLFLGNSAPLTKTTQFRTAQRPGTRVVPSSPQRGRTVAFFQTVRAVFGTSAITGLDRDCGVREGVPHSNSLFVYDPNDNETLYSQCPNLRPRSNPRRIGGHRYPWPTCCRATSSRPVPPPLSPAADVLDRLHSLLTTQKATTGNAPWAPRSAPVSFLISGDSTSPFLHLQTYLCGAEGWSCTALTHAELPTARPLHHWPPHLDTPPTNCGLMRDVARPWWDGLHANPNAVQGYRLQHPAKNLTIELSHFILSAINPAPNTVRLHLDLDPATEFRVAACPLRSIVSGTVAVLSLHYSSLIVVARVAATSSLDVSCVHPPPPHTHNHQSRRLLGPTNVFLDRQTIGVGQTWHRCRAACMHAHRPATIGGRE
jgi:hypothetical protein